MNAVDTNVLVYTVDRDSPLRAAALEFIGRLQPTDTVLLWQVACELAAVLGRLRVQGRTDASPTEIVHLYRSRYSLIIPTESVLSEAMRIHDQYQTSSWDALLLAACVDAGVTRLYTEDLQGRPVIEGVEIVNPFANA